jgi:hypothetical protein
MIEETAEGVRKTTKRIGPEEGRSAISGDTGATVMRSLGSPVRRDGAVALIW